MWLSPNICTAQITSLLKGDIKSFSPCLMHQVQLTGSFHRQFQDCLTDEVHRPRYDEAVHALANL